MKRIVTSVLVVALVLTMVFALVSCGSGPDGEYKGILFSLVFDGDEVTLKVFGSDTPLKADYTVDDDGNIKIEAGQGQTWPTNLVYDADNDEIDCKYLGLSYSLKKAD